MKSARTRVASSRIHRSAWTYGSSPCGCSATAVTGEQLRDRMGHWHRSEVRLVRSPAVTLLLKVAESAMMGATGTPVEIDGLHEPSSIPATGRVSRGAGGATS